jgi:DNA-directed RNA polymerase specialized sigma24 family protein
VDLGKKGDLMASDSIGSITICIRELREGRGDPRAAVQRIWDYLFPGRGDKAARHNSRRAVADGEDAVMSALASLWRMAQSGRFPDLGGREDLKRLFGGIVRHKLRKQDRRESRIKRGGGRVLQEAALEAADGPSDGAGLAELAVSHEPDPESAAIAAEEWNRRFGLLDEDQRLIVCYRLEGLPVAEIARRTGYSARLIYYRMEKIRDIGRDDG